MYRQGDVLLIPCNDEISGDELKPVGNRHVLAEGEATGHAHVVNAQNAQLYKTAHDTLLLILNRTTQLKHEEHGKINVPPGKYRVVRQREYNPENVRYVAD